MYMGRKTGQALLQCDWKEKEWEQRSIVGIRNHKMTLWATSENTAVGGLWARGTQKVRKWTFFFRLSVLLLPLLKITDSTCLLEHGAKLAMGLTVTCYESQYLSLGLILSNVQIKCGEESCQWLEIIVRFNAISAWPNCNCVTSVWLLHWQLVLLTAIKPAP